MKIAQFIEENDHSMNEIEKQFVTDIFYPYAGENGLDFLEVQTLFEDSDLRKRKLDFTVKTNRYYYVIEIDGYTYHAEGAMAVTPEYFDDLINKHNDLILTGAKLIRFTYNQIRNNPKQCMDTLRRAFQPDAQINPYFLYQEDFKPTYPQEQALDAIQRNRNRNENSGVLVLPTGMGKTVIAALDAKRLNVRTLFIVHRNSILGDAYERFESVWPSASKGFFNATEKNTEAQVIFASKDTLYREGNMELFDKEAFDLIIIDEVHHAAAQTYRKIIDYFVPEYMLGMTATPDRQDRADILELFEYKVYYQLDQKDAIEGGYLSGFKYYGLTDTIDYTSIRHNGIRYDVADLGRKLNIPERNQAIFDKFQEIIPDSKTLGFCVDIQHSISMADYFNQRGILSAAIHSDNSDEENQINIQRFKDNELQILFTVDMFNEGVDFPDVEGLLFLRPTESKTIFIQQLGRGLRLNPDKSSVTVLDFIGNFKKADNITKYIKGGNSNKPEDNQQTRRVFGNKEFLDWPLGTEVHFDESVEELFKAMSRAEREITKEDLIENYYTVKEKIQRKPIPNDLTEENGSQFRKASYDNLFGSWSKFLSEIGEATKASYHYPQGTHLGHIFYIIDVIGSKKFTNLVSPERYAPEGRIDKLTRQTRYKIWACMELGLIYDDRDPDSTSDSVKDNVTFTNLTDNGQYLYDILTKTEKRESFYNFDREDSWQMTHKPEEYNLFISNLPADEKLVLSNIFLEMDAVKQMLKYLFHEDRREVYNRSEFYQEYFGAPFIMHYFEMHGIEVPSVEGAKRRLPFILNILNAFSIVNFVGRSQFSVNALPLTEDLFKTDSFTSEENISLYINYLKKIISDLNSYSNQVTELRINFGKDFLTENYHYPTLEYTASKAGDKN